MFTVSLFTCNDPIKPKIDKNVTKKEEQAKVADGLQALKGVQVVKKQ